MGRLHVIITPLIYELCKSVSVNLERSELGKRLKYVNFLCRFTLQVVDVDMALIKNNEQVKHCFRV